MNKLKLTILAVALGSLVGCASVGGSTSAGTSGSGLGSESTEEQVKRKMVESIRNIEQTLQFIEKVERGPGKGEHLAAAAERAKLGKDGKPLPTGEQVGAALAAADLLDARMDMAWKDAGAEELLRKISAQVGATFKTDGSYRSTAAVTIKGEKISLRDVLASIGNQIDATADVVFYKTTHPATIELRFKK